jgi:hypothetical protein
MDLRPELLPPILDEAKVRRLAKLAARIDGANPGQWEYELAEFNQLAGMALRFGDFQGIYGGEEHDRWVRRVLVRQQLRPASNVTRAELEEIVRRAMPQNHDPEYDAYMQIFEVNVPLKRAASLLSYAPDYDPKTNTWGGGRPQCEYDPTPAQIVEWALAPSRETANP